MSVFSDVAAELEKAAAAMNASLAIDVARAQAVTFLGIEKSLTPKRTGRLAGSETVDSVSGSGAYAVAKVSPHTIYAEFRNDGGTLTKHGPGSLGNPGVGWFGHSVTQAGSHYVERAEGAAAGALGTIAAEVLDTFLTVL